MVEGRSGSRTPINGTLMQLLSEHQIIAIMRGTPEDKADAAAQALFEGGIVLLEVTLNTAGALGMISRFRERYAGRMRIGAGTVLDLDQAKQAVKAGAEYLISPNLDEEVIHYGIQQGIEVWPGVMTPTEITRAYKAGASAVKLFPLGSMGMNYLKEIRAPLGHIPMIATGGVNLQNIRTVLDAGAVAVGLGGNLVDKKLITEDRFDELRQLAQAFTAEVRGDRLI